VVEEHYRLSYRTIHRNESPRSGDLLVVGGYRCVAAVVAIRRMTGVLGRLQEVEVGIAAVAVVVVDGLDRRSFGVGVRRRVVVGGVEGWGSRIAGELGEELDHRRMAEGRCRIEEAGFGVEVGFGHRDHGFVAADVEVGRSWV